VKLTLLVRAYCHLCDEMSEDLAPLLASCDATVELLDVDADPVLEARWGDKVPVLLGGEQELCRYRLDAAAVLRWLRDATDIVSR
jgi:thioredoxin reductase (NADPH)